MTVQSFSRWGYDTTPLLSLSAGIAGTLRGLLGDGDAVVRQRSAHALGLMAGEDWYGKVFLVVWKGFIRRHKGLVGTVGPQCLDDAQGNAPAGIHCHPGQLVEDQQPVVFSYWYGKIYY